MIVNFLIRPTLANETFILMMETVWLGPMTHDCKFLSNETLMMITA